jgi:AcrR family transcriptional regulator
MDLKAEKGFTAISVQEIADRANIHRGTFYTHFPDKYALLDAILQERFRTLLARQLPSEEPLSRENLHQLIYAVLTYFQRVYHRCHPLRIIDSSLERTAQQELFNFLLMRLKQEQKEWRVPPEMIARVMSWTICGAAVQLSKEDETASLAQTTHDILSIVMEGVDNLALMRHQHR